MDESGKVGKRGEFPKKLESKERSSKHLSPWLLFAERVATENNSLVVFIQCQKRMVL